MDNIQRMAMLSKILKKEAKTIGFVPTMGYFHDGHLSLIKTAKQHMDVAVVSIFVNPKQFSHNEDLDKYPRDLKRDEEMARLAGADVLFHPSLSDMYPDGYATYVNVEGLADTLCGGARPGHFKGVATVVTKLFGIVKPDIAYFGQKDAQQSIIIKKMVQDLNMDIDIKVLPTVREKDGLAMSSRNMYLSEKERKDALCLNQALIKAEAAVKSGERDAVKIIKMIEGIIKERPGAKIDYIEAVDTKTLNPVDRIVGETLVALAVFIGNTRLIDNTILNP
ncbi:MAG: pantoate--beta-alanine ligase [Candidatus Omnitrophica bacterium]|nr:pantoate--beta-alanine ligase [Candidatus Omnitrophota bacterium]